VAFKREEGASSGAIEGGNVDGDFTYSIHDANDTSGRQASAGAAKKERFQWQANSTRRARPMGFPFD
jgi:hypothetical protein